LIARGKVTPHNLYDGQGKRAAFDGCHKPDIAPRPMRQGMRDFAIPSGFDRNHKVAGTTGLQASMTEQEIHDVCSVQVLRSK
jgi:hypothetical protein